MTGIFVRTLLMVLLAGVSLAVLARPAVAQLVASRDVISVNLCSDQLLVALAPERIATLSPLAREAALSSVAVQARGFPVQRLDAESLIQRHPSLVIGGNFAATLLMDMIEARGIKVMKLSIPADFGEVAGQVEDVASRLGVPERGAALVASMRARLGAITQARGRALLVEPRLLAPGPNSFEASVLTAAGFTLDQRRGAVSLESLLTDPPDVLVVPRMPEMPSLATEVLDHPGLARIRRIYYEPALLACPGPQSVAGVVDLAAQWRAQ